MGGKCHFAHGKEELRNMHDPLPPNTPYIADPKAKKVAPNGKGGKGHYGKPGDRHDKGKARGCYGLLGGEENILFVEMIDFLPIFVIRVP